MAISQEELRKTVSEVMETSLRVHGEQLLKQAAENSKSIAASAMVTTKAQLCDTMEVSFS